MTPTNEKLEPHIQTSSAESEKTTDNNIVELTSASERAVQAFKEKARNNSLW